MLVVALLSGEMPACWRRGVLWSALILGVAPGIVPPALTTRGAPFTVALDHVPVAVGNLEAAAARYAAMGFALKVGRPHANGITNRHAKFTNGTELELITAPAPADDLTRYYRRLIEAGDGAGFLALHPSDHDETMARLSRAGLPARRSAYSIGFPYDDPLAYLFFAGLNHSPTDRPEHFAHANTAVRLSAAWLAADDFPAEARVFNALGLTVNPSAPEFPFAPDAGVVPLADGAVYLLPGRHGRPSRRVVGVTLAARDLGKAAARLEAAGVPFRTLVTRSGRQSLLVDPADAFGIWLELRAALD
jgi:hypothetical protein